ncbi:unnamed protein product [Ilex paraguariensis]|uniref:Uncharacterized protein n=1 Tax=Ilex paraguariensis TaxID=185542 RepID=A0ABC8QNK0_9AQUA
MGGDDISNHGLLPVLLVTQMDMLIANGVGARVSSFLVITCYAKSLPETRPVLFVLERDQDVAPIAREQAIVQSGWKNLQFPSSVNS